MSTSMIIIGSILIAFAIFLIIAVLAQEGKSHNLSGTIAGGADSFFGKSKGKKMNKTLSILTTTVAIIFVLLVTSVYIMQDTGSSSDFGSFWEMVFGDDEEEVADTTAAITSAETSTDTSADTTAVADTTTAG